MDLIAGTIILRNNKILMVKEAKKECYGKWSFSAGHIAKGENICHGAKRETFEESGCEVELLKLFPKLILEDRNITMIFFLAHVLKENPEYSSDEILETKWISIEKIKEMNKEEFRNYAVVEAILNSLNNNELYEINEFENILEKNIHG